MAYVDDWNLATTNLFQQQLAEALCQTALAIQSEVSNDTQTLSFGGTVSGGTFTISYSGQTTAALNWNASAGDVQLKLQSLSNIGSGNIQVTGGPAPGTPLTITAIGTLAGNPIATMTTASSLTGTAPTVTITHTTFGLGAVSHSARAALASKVLANPVGYAALMAPGVTANGALPNPGYTDAQIATRVSAVWNAYC